VNRRSVLRIALFASVQTCFALPVFAQTPPQPPTQTLTAADAQADVALMRRALETIHPGLHRRTPNRVISAALDRLARDAAQPMQDTELYRRISQVLALIRCTHTKAEQTRAMEAWRTGNPSHLPFRFRLIEGRMIVVSSDPAQTMLPRGTEVVSINGQPVRTLVRTLGAYVPIDGETPASRDKYLGDDGDLMGANFDHFYPYVYGFADRFDVVVREGAGRKTVQLKPLSFRDWVKLPYDGAPNRADFGDTTTWRMLDATTGYLRVATFVNYRKPVDAAALYAKALGELRSQGMQRLVVDLRDNGGGSNDASLALIDILAQAPYTYQRAVKLKAIRYGDLPQYISSWGNRDALFNPPLENYTRDGAWYDLKPEFSPDELKPRAPAPNAFAGPVSLLISPANASGATMVVAKLKDMGRVRLVGETSGGSADGPTAGVVFMLKLPKSGITVRIPVAWNQMEVARFNPKGGVAPDVQVTPTVADFRAGVDRALQVAAGL
jgi:hypothetical protein